MTEPIIIGIESIKFLPSATTFMKNLFYPTPFNGTLTLHDENDVNYQVPVGKKYIILKVSGGGQIGALNTNLTVSVNIWKNNLVDSVVGATQIYRRVSGVSMSSPGGTPNGISQADLPLNDLVYLTIAAGQYINVVSGTTGLQVLGVECNV